MNRKVLILCHDFPPLNSVGAMRPLSWFNDAPTHGFYPVVVCMQPPKHLPQGKPLEQNDNGTIIRVDTKLQQAPSLIRKANTFINLFAQHVVGLFDAKRAIYNAAAKYLTTNPVDVIVACGEPFVLFHYAYNLSRRFNIPWVADYRDGWTTNHLPDDTPLKKTLRKRNRRFEKRYLASTLFFSSVSQKVVNRIREELCPTGTAYELRNGVDLDALKKSRSTYKNTGVFRVVYTGILYEQRYIEVFVEGFKKFVDTVKPENFEINFYGIEYQKNSSYHRIKELSEQYPHYIHLLPRVPLSEALRLQCEATLLLSFIAGTQAYGLYGTKTFEYMATGRPTLVIPSIPDKRTDLFPDKSYQLFAIDADEVAATLTTLYNAHRNGDSLDTGITPEEVYSISRQRSTQLLFQHIDEALAAKKHGR